MTLYIPLRPMIRCSGIPSIFCTNWLTLTLQGQYTLVRACTWPGAAVYVCIFNSHTIHVFIVYDSRSNEHPWLFQPRCLFGWWVVYSRNTTFKTYETYSCLQTWEGKGRGGRVDIYMTSYVWLFCVHSFVTVVARVIEEKQLFLFVVLIHTRQLFKGEARSAQGGLIQWM